MEGDLNQITRLHFARAPVVSRLCALDRVRWLQTAPPRLEESGALPCKGTKRRWKEFWRSLASLGIARIDRHPSSRTGSVLQWISTTRQGRKTSAINMRSGDEVPGGYKLIHNRGVHNGRRRDVTVSLGAVPSALCKVLTLQRPQRSGNPPAKLGLDSESPCSASEASTRTRRRRKEPWPCQKSLPASSALQMHLQASQDRFSRPQFESDEHRHLSSGRSVLTKGSLPVRPSGLFCPRLEGTLMTGARGEREKSARNGTTTCGDF
jgi:hypothetical protein